MDTSSRILMWQAVAAVLFLLPVIVAASFSLLWRRRLERPWAFFALGACVLYVLYFAIGELIFTPAVDAYLFVPSAGSPRAAEPRAPFFLELLPTPVMLVAVAFPTLWWIRSLLPKR